MTKRELIDEILVRNRTARPSFLARFPDEELQQYLQHLEVLRKPRLTGDASRYEKYFANQTASWVSRRTQESLPSPQAQAASQAA